MGNHFRRVGAALLIVGALGLTGCGGAAEAETEPTPEKTVNPNAQACADAANASMTMADALNGEDVINEWEAVRVEFDEIALSAEGDVKDRVQQLVDEWPKAAEIVVYRDVDDFNANLAAVERACAVDPDTEVDIAQLG
jgi:hypothetical protein